MSYLNRIKKPIDIVKQPWLDFERAVSFVIYQILKAKYKPRSYPDKVTKILLIRRNRLGDAINILPSVDLIKRSQPNVEIHVLANQYNQVVFQYSPSVDKVHIIDEKWGLGKISLFMHPVLLKLREEQFDVVIGVGGYSSVLAQLVAWVKGKYNVGPLSKKATFYDLIYDYGITYNSQLGEHHVYDMAYIVRQAGFVLPDVLPYTHIARPHTPNPKWLGICPDVKRKESRYPLEQYGEVISILLNNGIVEKVLLFTETKDSDYRQLEQFGAEWIGTSNVDEFIQQVSFCQVVITAEGGGAHITGALGLGVVVLSGMGHQDYWRPYAQHIKVLEQKHAIREITPITIASQVNELLNEMA